MGNTWKLCALAVPVALAFGSAHAADLPTKKPGPRPPIVTDPGLTPLWTGFFLGGQLGYGWDGEEVRVPSVSSVSYSVERHGPFGGLTGGYNYQINNLVLGVEAEYNLSNINGGAAIDQTYVETNDIHSFGSIDGKIGYAFDKFLVYGLGGVGFADISHTLDVPFVAFQRFSSFHTGYNVGLGVAYAFDRHWSVFAEYRYYHFPPRDFASMPVLGPHNTLETVSNARLGVAYRFGD
jgi:outer membrane immunogenic protein